MCSGGRSPAISVDFGSLWVATQSSWPAAGVLRHDTHIFLWMATLTVRRLSYRIRIFISENNDHTIIHFGKFVWYVFSEIVILRGKVVSFISENSYHTYFRKFVWYAFSFSKFVSIRIFIIKVRVDTHFHADTFSAPLGIQLIPSSRQVPALTRNPQGRQPSTQGYSWWHLRLSHTFVAFLLCTCADQMF